MSAGRSGVRHPVNPPTNQQRGSRVDDRFAHEALLYDGVGDFVEHSAEFLREGFASEQAMLVAVSATKIDLLREELSAEIRQRGDLLEFVDMAEIGVNPARIIPAWWTFVDTHTTGGRRVRGIGEPVWVERTPAELVECQRHESLLNVAFDHGVPWRLLCPYDTTTLSAAVIEEAQRSHPLLVTDGVRSGSDSYLDLLTLEEPLGGDLTEPPVVPDEVRFDAESLAHMRAFVALQGELASLGPERTINLVLAINELAANSLRHGGGHGVLRMWTDGNLLVSEIRDDGHISHPLVGRVVPAREQEGGRGIWIVNQLCELVQIRSTRTGTVVRVSTRRDA
jgi:anti-sigma regulatory factor (Ser/Thr protein kinase)